MAIQSNAFCVMLQFERVMEQVLREFISKICLVYLVIIYSTTFEEMIQNLKRVLSHLREVNLKVNPKKYILFSQKLKYLGQCNLI